MSDLTLNIHYEGEITLPGELSNSTLTLAEIGAVVCFAAMQQGIMPEGRMASEEMKTATAALKEKGVLKVSFENRMLKIALELDAVLPSVDDGDEG